MLGGLWVPAFAGKTRDRKARGPGTAVVPLSQYGPQRSGLSAGTMPGFPPRSFPPRKRGPRNRGGAVVTERTSAQRIFRRHNVRVSLKEQHAPCCGGCGGSMSFWLPSNAPRSLGPGARRDNEGQESERPRKRGGAAATARTSAQRAFRRHGAGALLKHSTLRAAE